ncbi:MAG: hypothetical protein H7A37_04275 [Chlamydiales bacterium]|nr:hypothetical protein [Chlamydiales bacterium]
MQIYARNDSNFLIAAVDADKNSDYYCLECGGTVRCRGGIRRRCHYYHLCKPRRCRQEGKSLVHLQVQEHLHHLLPGSALEVRFDAIDRIADVVWEQEKLIFEVQCSAISAEELQARNADYGKLGYQVVWVLHDRRYNRRHLSDAELVLQGSPHYFTNMTDVGSGQIYDQRAWIEDAVRRRWSGRAFVDLSKPERLNGELFFSGDLRARIDTKKLPIRRAEWIYGFWERLVCHPYRLLLQVLLERACR